MSDRIEAIKDAIRAILREPAKHGEIEELAAVLAYWREHARSALRRELWPRAEQSTDDEGYRLGKEADAGGG